MCEGRVSFAVDRDGIEEACGGHEVLPISLLTSLGLNHGWSCKQVNRQLGT